MKSTKANQPIAGNPNNDTSNTATNQPTDPIIIKAIELWEAAKDYSSKAKAIDEIIKMIEKVDSYVVRYGLFVEIDGLVQLQSNIEGSYPFYIQMANAFPFHPEEVEKNHKKKNQPTPTSANGKRAYQSLPKIMVSRQQMEGTPVIQDQDMAINIFRSYFTPEVWVQMHLFAMYTDNWDNLIGLRRLNTGTQHRVEADIKTLMHIGLQVGARHISLCLTRTSWNTDSSFETDAFMKLFAKKAHEYEMSLGWFFIMSQNHEEDITTELNREEILGTNQENIFILY